jgi:hypothetical protein
LQGEDEQRDQDQRRDGAEQASQNENQHGDSSRPKRLSTGAVII